MTQLASRPHALRLDRGGLNRRRRANRGRRALAAVSNSGWQLDLFLGVVSGIGTVLIGSVLGAA